jgi:hypothetical protein
MPDKEKSDNAFPEAEISEFTLRIPGEYFFCETIPLPSTLGSNVEEESVAALTVFIQEILQDTSFSPYPEEQLAWGYFGGLEEGKVILFACPLMKLRQLGWQNMEVFRRVFPSFVSFFGKKFPEPTILFLKEGETLSVGVYEADSVVPDQVFSMPIDAEEAESLEIARGKLLSLVNIENHEIVTDILEAGEIERLKDGYFLFAHEWMEGKDPNLEIDQSVKISSDQLWTVDLRSHEFKSGEIKRRRQGRKRWKATLAWSLSMAAILVLFLGVKIMGVKLEDKQKLAEEMAMEVPLVIDSQKLLEKLRQNKLGGIDPFGAIGRLYAHLGGESGDLNVWFTFAHFKSRNEIELEGEGKNVESINTFLENLEKNKVASLQIGRGGKELREIKSQTGKTTFEFNIELKEQIPQEVTGGGQEGSGI